MSLYIKILTIENLNYNMCEYSVHNMKIQFASTLFFKFLFERVSYIHIFHILKQLKGLEKCTFGVIKATKGNEILRVSKKIKSV